MYKIQQKRRLFVIAAFVMSLAILAYAAPEITIRALRLLHTPVPESLEQVGKERRLARLQRQAADGDCHAQYDLAQVLHFQQFPHRYSISKQGEARKWLLRSAENGCVGAMTEIAEYAEHAGDQREAFGWYKKAAELGDPDAELEMGNYYAGDDYVDFRVSHQAVVPDLEVALQWYKRALNSGYHAEHYIADVYSKQNILWEADSWYQRALKAGDPWTAEWRGGCYKCGCRWPGLCGPRESCPKDLYQAYLWLRVADFYGNCLGCYREMIPQLSGKQVSQADAESLAWTRAHPKLRD